MQWHEALRVRVVRILACSDIALDRRDVIR
jgi:hypothetical protein